VLSPESGLGLVGLEPAVVGGHGCFVLHALIIARSGAKVKGFRGLVTSRNMARSGIVINAQKCCVLALHSGER
jgi:hypothetical protein